MLAWLCGWGLHRVLVLDARPGHEHAICRRCGEWLY